jgi:hypothetical protein
MRMEPGSQMPGGLSGDQLMTEGFTRNLSSNRLGKRELHSPGVWYYDPFRSIC